MIVKELDLSGKDLSNYKIIEKIGKGGMATVYKAHERSLNRMVALKVLSSRLSEDKDFIKRFQREAQAAAKLNHPNIVQIYAIGETEGVHYFAMEYIKGRPLSDIKKEEGVLNPEKAVAIIKQVAEALGEAHKVGLVHRDIKPSNIMMDESGRAKVTDFGIAHVVEAETKLTREGSIIGTPEYLSPEQCEGKPVDGRSDIYSLGVTLYEIIGGQTPYEADTPVSMLMKIVQGQFLPLDKVNADVPKPLQEVVEKMMHTDPNQRYADTAAVIQDLERIQKELGYAITATATGVGGPISSRTTPHPTAKEVPEVQDVEEDAVTHTIDSEIPAKKSSSRFWIGYAVVLVILMIVTGILALKIMVFDVKSALEETTIAEKQDTPPATTEEATTSEDAFTGNETAATGESSDMSETGDTGEASETASTEETPSEVAATEGTVSDSTQTETIASGRETVSGSEGQSGTVSSGQGSVSVGGTGSSTVSTGQIPAQQGTTTTTGSSSVSSRPVSSHRQPPPKSIMVSLMGGDNNGEILESYAQKALRRAGYKLVDERSVRGNAGNFARYRLELKMVPGGTESLEFFGRQDTRYSYDIFMSIKKTRGGGIVAGPETKTVKFTSTDRSDQLQQAVDELTRKLLSNL